MIKSKQIHNPRLVLVVDDHEINRDALEVILEEDYNIIFAENGMECMEKLQEYKDELSIVLLDLNMPEMTGYEVLEKVKKDEALKHIPIIVLTADKSAELKALEMGAADFITKPFDIPGIILARVGRIIELSEGRKLISAAEKDPLTKLYTGSFFFEYAERLFRYHKKLSLDAVVLNIEQFHIVNALNGRDFGDDILSLIGGEINRFLAESVGIACRTGADNFNIYCVGQQDYRELLRRFQSAVNDIAPNVRIHLRMGVRTCQEGVEPVILFDQARAACNVVRGDYQNPLMIYDDNMYKRELLSQRLLNDLRAAVLNKQFKVYYQPKYDIQSDPPRLASAEALIRWKHPELGMISPGDFIPLFEGNGLIGIVDSFVWQEAAHQISEWRQKYGYTLPISVNLSRTDVYDLTLVDRLISLVENSGLDYKDIKLEVTESAYTDNARVVLDVIHRLQKKGFDIEMDDFGSGYSSLNMLSEMPIDVLKMDMKFIRNIETSETDRRLVNLILDIARYLNVKVVAEGVETEGQLGILKDGRCHLAQGYYFSKPLPPEEFEKLIEKELQAGGEEF